MITREKYTIEEVMTLLRLSDYRIPSEHVVVATLTMIRIAAIRDSLRDEKLNKEKWLKERTHWSK